MTYTNSLRLLQGLDEDLLRKLDAVCHENQLACYPVSRGRNTEDYIFERYPEIVALVESDRQERIESMKLRLRLNRAESYEGRPRPTANEKTPVSPSPKPKAGITSELPSSPILKSKQSTGDLMFQMDDDVPLTPAPVKGKSAIRGVEGHDASTRVDRDFPALGSNLAVRDKDFQGEGVPSQDAHLEESPSNSRIPPPDKRGDALSPPEPSSHPAWGSPAHSNAKRGLKEIMAETSQTRQLNNTQAAYNSREPSGNFASKPSQKERKKLQQQQTQENLAADETSKETMKNPWATPAKKQPEASNGLPESTKPAQKPSMTLRQTVAGTPPPKPKDGPTPSQPQSHGIPTNQHPQMQTPTKHPIPGPSAAPQSTPPNTTATQRTVQSIRHIPRPEPQQATLHSSSSQSQSLASIFMQQQTEKNEIREAATAKHNLEDIQLEQQFQEWWDKESKRVQEQTEAETSGPTTRGGRSGRGKGNRQSSGQKKRRGGGGPAGGGKDTNKGARSNNNSNNSASNVSALTQQLPRHTQQKTTNHHRRENTHPEQQTPNSTRHKRAV